MGRIVRKDQVAGNGFTIEETVIYEKDGSTKELDMSPDRFAIELDPESYVENDIPSDNDYESFDLY